MWESRHKASPLIPHLGQFPRSQRRMHRRKTTACVVCLIVILFVAATKRRENIRRKGRFLLLLSFSPPPAWEGANPCRGEPLDLVWLRKCARQARAPFSDCCFVHLGVTHHLSPCSSRCTNIYFLALWSRCRHLQSTKECRARDLCSRPPAFSTRLK